MYNKNDKRRLYWLMDFYLSGKITASTFRDEFYYSYDLEINSNDFSDKEEYYFSQLANVSARFSEFEEDLQKYPGTYFTEDELREEIIETKEKLKSEN